jgi:hypothetical protein
MRPPREDTKPWYKQFWPWFIISLPLSVVIASMFTINLAIKTSDGLVSDDYYKEGLGIHKDAASTAKAKALGIAGDIAYDGDTGSITLALDSELNAGPGSLLLNVTHPTMPNQDQSIVLTRLDGRRYTGRLEPLNNANWQLEIEPEDAVWRIRGRLQTPGDGVARIN